MDWQGIFNILIKFGISGATITLLIGYFGKKVIEQYLKAKLENHKNELDKETILFRAGLEKIQAENSIRYQKIFEERANCIKDLYVLLTSLETNLKNLVTSWQGPEWLNKEKDDIANKSLTDFKLKFYPNKIYLSKEHCDLIEKIIIFSRDTIYYMGLAKERAKTERLSRDEFEEAKDSGDASFQLWLKSEKDVEKIFIPLKVNIENEFRKLIGVE